MKFTSYNQDSNILDEIVISKFESFPFLLNIINDNPRKSQNELKKKSKFSNGKIYLSVKALKLMNFITNGNGLEITELGLHFLKYYQLNKKIPYDILNAGCLKVPLFKEIYGNNPHLTDPQQLFTLFQNKIKDKYPDFDSKMIGSTVRRYLMGIHNKKLDMRTKVNPIIIIDKILKKKIINEQSIDVIRNFKNTFNLSNEEILKMIESLPEKKRSDIFSQVFLKVL